MKLRPYRYPDSTYLRLHCDLPKALFVFSLHDPRLMEKKLWLQNPNVA